jgi:hypothetical protein
MASCHRKKQEGGRQPNERITSDASKKIFVQTLDWILKDVTDLTVAKLLYTSDRFIGIYEHPVVYMQDAVAVLHDTTVVYELKQIAVYSMQKLDDQNYISFCRNVIQAVRTAGVSEHLMVTAVFHSLNRKYQIIRNYRDKDVIEMLKDWRSITQSRKNAQNVNHILSGQVWINLQDLVGE